MIKILNIFRCIKNKMKGGEERTTNVKKNIIAMFFLKGINILTGFLIVPITIHYVNPTTYGIWLTLSSVIVWIYYFDLGLPNGFRNKFAEAKANDDVCLARKYLSTTYCLLAILLAIVFVAILLINEFVDWSSLLHIDSSYQSELHDICIILGMFVCLRIVVSIFTTMLMANQEPAKSAAVQAAGQVLALLAIYILTKTTTGNLLYLAVALSGIPCVTILVLSVIAFMSKSYRLYAPSFKYVDFRLTKEVTGKGVQFFVISIAIVLILQVTNVIISRELGSLYVTQYNVAFKYFSIIYMGMEMIAAPFWSGFTEAYTKKEFVWMRQMLSNLDRILVITIVAVVLMIIAADVVVNLWIRDDSVQIPFSLSVIMGAFVFFQSAYCIYSNLVNGTGHARLQVIVFGIFAIISLPIITIGTRSFGLWGSMILPTIAYIVLAVVCRIQISKIIIDKAFGIWKK